jgi:hypothetical protein
LFIGSCEGCIPNYRSVFAEAGRALFLRKTISREAENDISGYIYCELCSALFQKYTRRLKEKFSIFFGDISKFLQIPMRLVGTFYIGNVNFYKEKTMVKKTTIIKMFYECKKIFHEK